LQTIQSKTAGLYKKTSKVAAISVFEVAVFLCLGWPFSIVLPGRFRVFRASAGKSIKKGTTDAD